MMSDPRVAARLTFRPLPRQGLALGVTYVKAGFSTVKYLILGLVFVLVTPVGIAIGIAVGTTYNR